ncbi:MAG: DUF4129 domain-containing protein [Treponema sp.]|jgi:hypothetical protein|nr:DUF4129 domain-containing protein [Treponema sp.]
MKSSDASGQSVQPAMRAVYTLVSLYMPFSILICALPLIDRLVSAWLSGFAMPYLPIALGSLISALSASVYITFVKHNKSGHSAGDIRGVIVMATLAYLLSSAFRFDKPFLERLFPGIGNLLSALCALSVWAQVIILKRLFAARETFERYTAMYDGEQLQHILHEDEDMMVSTSRMMWKYRPMYTGQLVFILTLSCVCVALRIQIPLLLFVFLVILVISASVIFAMFGVFNQEQYYAGEGMSLSASQRSKRLFAMLMLTCAIALLGAILASNTSVLPFSLVTGFFAWLLSLIPKAAPSERPLEPRELAPNMGMDSFRLPEGLTVDENYKPFPFWEYLQYAALALLVIGFLWFMVKPLLTRRGKDAPFLRRLARLLAEWLKDMKAALTSFIASLRHDAGVRLDRTNAEAIRRLETSLLEGYSAAKRRDMKRSAGLFVRLILWGSETCQVRWKPSRAPGEYCAILADAAAPLFPQLPLSIIRCGDLFERALYAKDPLSKEEREEFAARVEEIATSEKLLAND